MEFKKREVKKVKNKANPNQTPNGGDFDSKKEYTFENKVILVSLICEVFEFEEIETVANNAPLKFSNTGYNIENRMKSFVYPIEEAKDIQNMTSYWNSWANERGKKIKFSIRQKTKNKEKVETA